MVALDAVVVGRRLLALNEALEELSRPEAGDPARLIADRVLRAAVERWLQVAIEACIDVADHVIAAEGWTPPESGRAAMMALAGHGLISADLARNLALAVGMRNLLVHQYASVDLTLVARAVREDVGDLQAFAGTAASWLAPASSP